MRRGIAISCLALACALAGAAQAPAATVGPDGSDYTRGLWYNAHPTEANDVLVTQSADSQGGRAFTFEVPAQDEVAAAGGR